MRALPSVHTPWLPAWPWAPLCPNSAPFPFPGTIHRGTCSIAFPTQPLKSRSQICLTEPGALSVKTAASGRRWQPPRGKRGNLEDSFSESLPCREMQHASLPKLSQKVVSLALIPRSPPMTSCHLCDGPTHPVNSKACGVLASTAYSAYAACSKGKDASGPSTPSLPSPCICSSVPGTGFPLLPSPGTQACTHMCLHTQYYMDLGQTLVSSDSLVKASHP